MEKTVLQLCAIDLRWGDVVEIDGKEFQVGSIARIEDNGWITPEIRIDMFNIEEDVWEKHFALISDVYGVTSLFPRH